MIRMTFRKDVTRLDRLDEQILPRAARITEEVADEVIQDIRDNWSASSPSSPGEPPAVVTGRLNASLSARRRDERGRFTRAGATDVVEVSVTAGTEYAAALEYGYSPRNLAPRPFLRPAVVRAARRLKDHYRHIFRFI